MLLYVGSALQHLCMSSLIYVACGICAASAGCPLSCMLCILSLVYRYAKQLQGIIKRMMLRWWCSIKMMMLHIQRAIIAPYPTCHHCDAASSSRSIKRIMLHHTIYNRPHIRWRCKQTVIKRKVSSKGWCCMVPCTCMLHLAHHVAVSSLHIQRAIKKD